MAFLFSNQKVLRELVSLRQAVQEAKEAAEAAQSAAETAKNAVEAAEGTGLHVGSETIEGLVSLRQIVQEAKEAAEAAQNAAQAIRSTNPHTGSETIGDRGILPSDKMEVPVDLVSEPVSGAIIVEVMQSQTDFVGDDLLYVSADVKLPNGKKIHVVFSNPQTRGMFSRDDNIRIKQKGSEWEFIEHIP